MDKRNVPHDFNEHCSRSPASRSKQTPFPNPESRRTPRARYNRNFLSRLEASLEEDEECDLSNQLQRYSSSRLQSLRGSTTPQQHKSSIDTKPIKALEPCIPEPAGAISIAVPLSARVETLLAIQHREQPGQELSTTFWPFLRKGEILHRGVHDSRWIIRISEDLIVKCGPNVDIREIQTLNDLLPFKQRIPIPEPHGALSVGRWNYLFMSYIEGTPLSKLWCTLSSSLKVSLKMQLEAIFHCLRNIPTQSELFGSGTPPRCKDLRACLRVANTDIRSEAEFNSFLVNAMREVNPVYMKLVTSRLSTSHCVVMSHSDLHPGNILAQLDSGGGLQITGILDWEMSGIYPTYWEYVKALSKVNYDLSDWYSHLPTDAIGHYEDAWMQDSLITRVMR